LTLLIREEDVRRLLTMADAVRLVREALASQTTLGGQNLPRKRLDLNHGLLNIMSASVPAAHASGLKAYSVGRGGARFLVALWDRDDGRLLALIEADWLGRIRTGAASGVATDALAARNAATLAVIGSGKQARTQVHAIATVRELKDVRVFCRDPSHRSAFARDVESALGVAARPVDSPRDALADAEIVTTITTASEPVIEGEWLGATCHVNAAGSNFAGRRELGSSVLKMANTIAVDSLEQARIEAGDLLIPIEEGVISWDEVTELGEFLRDPTQHSGGVSVFKSLGVAVEDVAVARFVYDRAMAEGLGESTTFGEIAR